MPLYLRLRAADYCAQREPEPMRLSLLAAALLPSDTPYYLPRDVVLEVLGRLPASTRQPALDAEQNGEHGERVVDHVSL